MDWATAGATLLLVIVGGRQITAIRNENKMERTLTACNRYESDPIIERSVRTLRLAQTNGDFKKDPKSFEHDVVIILNYFDSIAIGIQQGLYDEKLARDHTDSIVKHYCELYLNLEIANRLDIRPDRDYERLCQMAQNWGKTQPYFQVNPRWWEFWK